MILRYRSGEEIVKGDHVLFHGEPARIEFVASILGNPETDWYIEEYGGGIMIADSAAGCTFIHASSIAEHEDLEFVRRIDAL